ncbi:hypothetical protein [Alkalicoccobacillus murimartini]|uniref:Uncharacterized protein n=1 Tax=Alkalicoccobacillus murimartini TaxID=171685 RepID=A0ABT9YMI1_9BACI|nr:hypothetical protein [Alkalicoccobacillus murimartini]MDQ0209095.1 hypothetical protein [Alkalicoccobacillus murimartini]
MKFIVNKLLLIGSLGVVLGACSAATDTEGSLENTAEEDVEEALEEALEAVEERSIVADEMTTTFYPEVTKLRDLTEEDLEWYDLIMTRLNDIDDFLGDKETVYEIAEEYGEDPEELWFDWLEIVDARWYGDNGDYAILPDAFNKLNDEILEKNIVGEKIEQSSSESNFVEKNLTTFLRHQLHVDGEPYEVSYLIEHRDDYKIAEIIEFSVNGEKVEL